MPTFECSCPSAGQNTQHNARVKHLRSLPDGPHLQELPAAGILLHTATATQSTGVCRCSCWGSAGGVVRRREGSQHVCRDAWVVGPRCHSFLHRHVGSTLRDEGSRTMAVTGSGSDRQNIVHAAHCCSLRACRVGCPCSQGAMLCHCLLPRSRQHQHTHAILCSSLSGRSKDAQPHPHADVESRLHAVVRCRSPERSHTA